MIAPPQVRLPRLQHVKSGVGGTKNPGRKNALGQILVTDVMNALVSGC